MKILFYHRGRESMGVEYLLAYVKARGHQADLVFDQGIDNNLFLKLDALAPLNGYDRLLRRAEKFEPDVIGATMFTNTFPYAQKFVRMVKGAFPGVKVVAGGPHPSILPDSVLEFPEFDYVIRGEAELPLAELLDKLEKGEDVRKIQSLCYRDSDGTFVKNPMAPLVEDLDTLPFPEKEPFYRHGVFRRVLDVIASRGCPYTCSYCINHTYQEMYRGKGVYARRRTVPNVIEELQMWRRTYKPKFVFFHDDLFTTSKKWLYEFAPAYRKEINLPFYCLCHPQTVDRDVVRLLKEAGCAEMFLGLDSGDERIRRDIMRRPVKNEEILNAANLVKEFNIRLQVSTIFALPTETPVEMMRTAELAGKCNANTVSSYMFYPFPETDLAELARKTGYLDEDGFQHSRRGTAGYAMHLKTLLRHPYEKEAQTISKLLPLYTRAPENFKRHVAKLMSGRHPKLAQFAYLATIPYTYPLLGIIGVQDTARMLLRHFIPAKAPELQAPRSFASALPLAQTA